MKEIIIIQMVVAVAVFRAIMADEEAEDAEEDEEVAVEEAATLVSICKQLNVSIVAKRVTILRAAQLQEIMTMNSQTWYPKRISKIYFNLH
jgi:hypothetical protein